MNSQTHSSVMGNRKNKAVVETVAQIVFTICAFFAVLAVVSITLYMIISGTPSIKSGIKRDSVQYRMDADGGRAEIRYSVGYPDFYRWYNTGNFTGCTHRRTDSGISGRGGT